ncbi:RCC1 domain-containing protein [Chondromyces crocatus]|uniref:RCC1-like domain-containing protein n=1 Tax=Chondromyces crocatus TaxID=52 RepID=A0A0K1ECX1_CHOCO|nr:hypothetical protein [Chondromyces crocatus]AKT38423.1 uncharacterized protein CMC5_025690 [Chondromyces crocatus]
MRCWTRLFFVGFVGVAGLLAVGCGAAEEEGGETQEVDECSPACAKAVDVAAGWSHTCAVLDDGRVKCWGDNWVGQLGIGDTRTRGEGPGQMGTRLPAAELGTGSAAVAVAAGAWHSCALLHGGSVKCWGFNEYGQLGVGDYRNRGNDPGEMGDALPAVDLGAGKTATAIVAGAWHSCALLHDGGVKCWGDNQSGQLGLGDVEARGDDAGEMGDGLPAVDLGAGQAAVAIAAGEAHTCALLGDGGVKCWGDNRSGRLGLGDVEARGDDAGEMGDSLPAVDLGAGQAAVAIAAGEAHTCALLGDQSVKCWGYSRYGRLGTGKDDRGVEPEQMGDELPRVDMGGSKKSMGLSVGWAHSCVLMKEGGIKCWGHNGSGQLGIGDEVDHGEARWGMSDSLPFVNVGAGEVPVLVRAGSSHTCALLGEGRLKCWGENMSGQLGLGDTVPRGVTAEDMGDALPAVKL